MDKGRAVITGATSGLGREMALQLARRGWRVAFTGRRKSLLEQLAVELRAAGGEALPLEGSVTDLAQVKSHYAAIRERWGGVDWAILNAGISEPMNAKRFNAEICHATLATNLGGVVNWMEAVLPDMIQAGSGTIAGVASLAAYRGLPGSGPYCASKAALVTLLESARVDLLGTGVHIVTVCPGFVKSEITSKRDPNAMPWLLETEDGAARILRGIERKQRLVHFPWQLSLLTRLILRNMPDFLYDRLAPRIAKTREGAIYDVK